MHGVHHVFDHIAVIATPFHVAEEGIPLRRGQLLGQVQRRRRIDVHIAVVDEDGTIAFGHVKAERGARAFELATRAARHARGGTVAANFYAMVGAAEAVTQDHTQRQRCTTVRAVIFQCVHYAGLVAPDSNLLAQTAQGDGLFLDKGRWAQGEPIVLQAVCQNLLHRVAGHVDNRCVHERFSVAVSDQAPRRAISFLNVSPVQGSPLGAGGPAWLR